MITIVEKVQGLISLTRAVWIGSFIITVLDTWENIHRKDNESPDLMSGSVQWNVMSTRSSHIKYIEHWASCILEMSCKSTYILCRMSCKVYIETEREDFVKVGMLVKTKKALF